MKNNISSILLLVLIFIGSVKISKAQFNASIGLEGAIMQGDFKSLTSVGFGATAGGELGLTEKSGLTAQVGYIYLIPEERYESAYMIPIQGGFKLYTNSKDEGIYIHFQVGAHRLSATRASFTFFGATIPKQTATNTDPSYGLGLGYIANKKLDIAIRYNLVSIDKATFNYIGIRVGYTFL